MNKLLFIEASPRGDQSYSGSLASAFIVELAKQGLDFEIDHFDLWSEPLPELTNAILAVKQALQDGEEITQSQGNTWRQVETVIERFTAADVYLMSVPMWNFGIPYKLKQFIDLVVQPQYTFAPRFDAAPNEWGLLVGKQAVIISTRGGSSGAGVGEECWEFQESYLRQVLRFIGVSKTDAIALEMTGVDDGLNHRLEAAKSQLIGVAEKMADTRE